MRQLYCDLFITLDGFAKGQHSPAFFGLLGPDLETWIQDEMARPQDIVMGRVTFELMATMAASGSDPSSQQLTDHAKVVFSASLPEPLAWQNSRRIGGANLSSVTALKAEPGPALRTIGSVSLVQSLLGMGVVDRLRLIVFPLVLGDTGQEPLFRGLPDMSLDLLDSRLLDGRLQVLDYRPHLLPRS
ncbi:dihydrofolate reductase family protein [Deinococcus sp. KSM4-11]|uniref:dihydrofolate reductase family protein n=1 Tax=Deinococcus sp. KSM4-11 TaxID=2568654 RepID=UPI001454E40D|nr:dihydrofolate reductase family protein [Deinococcus sp. KSM4-11]